MRVSLALIIAAAALSSTQTIESLPACGQQCISGVKAESNALGCPSGQLVCLCGIANYNFGIRDCAIQNCGADIASTVTNAASAECAAATGGAAASTPANTVPPATPPASTEAAPSTSAQPPPASTPSTAPAPTTTAPAESLAPTVPTVASLTTTSLSGFTTSVVPTSSGKISASGADGGVFAPTSSGSSTTSPTKASSSATTAASSSTASASSTGSSTLSLGAKAGIGIGAAAAASAIIAVAVFLVVRRRQKGQNATYLTSLKISDPLPGSGRSYANDHHHAQYETGTSDLETKSRRYEDMLPRTKPRHMI